MIGTPCIVVLHGFMGNLGPGNVIVVIDECVVGCFTRGLILAIAVGL
jgi:hypothetical protein